MKFTTLDTSKYLPHIRNNRLAGKKVRQRCEIEEIMMINNNKLIV